MRASSSKFDALDRPDHTYLTPSRSFELAQSPIRYTKTPVKDTKRLVDYTEIFYRISRVFGIY